MKSLLVFSVLEFICAILFYPEGIDLGFVTVPWWFYFAGGVWFIIIAVWSNNENTRRRSRL